MAVLTHALGLMLASDKVNKKIPTDTKLVISQADASNVLTINKKPQGNQPAGSHNQALAHTKEDLTCLYQDCFTGLFKLQGELHHIEVDPVCHQK